MVTTPGPSSGSLEVTNTIFESSLGTLVQTTNSNNTDTFISAGNYRLADESVLIGAGTTTTTTKDLLKNNLSNPPSIGAFEYVANTVQPEILTIKGLRFTLV